MKIFVAWSVRFLSFILKLTTARIRANMQFYYKLLLLFLFFLGKNAPFPTSKRKFKIKMYVKVSTKAAFIVFEVSFKLACLETISLF